MKNNGIIIVFILVIATLLRFYRFFDIPYTLDELSALNRTFYSSFSELIEKGVYNDGHPALIQVFLFYWVHWFSYNEWVVKLPFILMGIASIYLIYRIGEEWFSETVGIMASAWMATLQFTIMYSQIARPYASGLFFVLGMTFFWTLWLKKYPSKWFIALGYIIFTALSAYNHYFSLLQAVLIAFTGLFFISKKRLLNYVWLNLGAILLFLPHLSISLHQLSLGGLNWLTKPNYSFFISYFQFIFHFSEWILALFLIIFLYSVIQYLRFKPPINRKWVLISFFLFITPLLFGFYYSIYKKPILQYSVLIFSFPFFLLFVLSFIPNLNKLKSLAIVVIIVLMNITTLIFKREYYSFFYNQGYDAIAKNQIALIDSLKEPITLLIDGYEPFFLNYYAVKYQKSIPCALYTYDGFNEKNWELYIKKFKTNYIACSHVGVTNLNFIDIVQKYYPYFVKKSCGFAYEWYVFSKIPTSQKLYKFEKEIDFTRYDSLCKKNNGYRLSNEQEYGPLIEINFKELQLYRHDIIHIRLDIDSLKNEGTLVCELKDQNDSLLLWKGISSKQFLTLNKKTSIFLTIRMTDIKNFSDYSTLRTYFWNHHKVTALLKKISIQIESGNPYIYAIFNDF